MPTNEKIETLEREIHQLKERNARVEEEKAWETSYVRVFFIALITYAVAVGILYILDTPKFLFGALIPAAGYILSTQSLLVVKRWWMKRSGLGEGSATKSLF
ncbi:hypothetical protein C4585_00995 [Candidatus Parcubacteria bacterium]|nr:MAG: hypothetical protein C4585_00995 [Candidatus Parcubacteria bacterium]